VKTLMAATLALMAAPVLAQAAAPAPPAPPAPPSVFEAGNERMRVMRMGRHAMWPNVSPEGRAILRETLKGDPKDREATRAARDRINAVVGAEKLDVAALRRAMDEERRLVDAQHAARQARMLAAIQKLSPADRKAFAEDARRGRADVEARTAEWRKWAQEFRGRMKDMPPPPPMPPMAPVPPGSAIE
jgi:Spy/CpxP family protein refolding chaperone